MKARKIPTTIDTIQWAGDNQPELEEFTEGRFRKLDYAELLNRDDGMTAEVYDKLHNTWVGVKVGDWVIKGVIGEFYPCDDGVFRTTYEILEEE